MANSPRPGAVERSLKRTDASKCAFSNIYHRLRFFASSHLPSDESKTPISSSGADLRCSLQGKQTNLESADETKWLPPQLHNSKLSSASSYLETSERVFCPFSLLRQVHLDNIISFGYVGSSFSKPFRGRCSSCTDWRTTRSSHSSKHVHHFQQPTRCAVQ